MLKDPPKSLVSLAWNRERNQIAAGGWSRTFQLWNAQGEPESSQKQEQAILDIDFSPDGSRVALGLFRGKLCLAEADGSQGKLWEAHAGPTNAVAWSPAGDQMVSGAYDNTLRFWNAETADPERVVVLFSNGNAATFTPAGQLEQGQVANLEMALIYLVETEAQPGEIQMLPPSEFERLVSR